MNSENSPQNGNISMQDAISLLSTPPVEDTAVDETATEPEEVSPSEPEAEEIVEEVIETDAPDDDDEADEEEEYEAEGEEPEEFEEELVYTVKVDGQEYDVTLDELRNGYSRQQAYTKRSQELAEQRKAFEQEASEVKAMRDAYAQQLELLQGQLQQTTQQEPDWRMIQQEYGADQAFLMKTEWDQQQKQLAQVEAERQRIAQQQAQEQQKQMQEHLANQRLQMLERIPAWKDEERRNTERLEVIKYAQEKAGFSEQEVAQASDARAIELLYKAWQWDKLQEKTPTARKKVRKAPKMAKSGQPKGKKEVATRQRRESLKKLDKLKSVDAAVEFLMNSRS